MIKLYNTLTHKEEEFTLLNEGVVTMYNCGPTVYGYSHIGNLRSYVFADTLRRVFEYEGLSVRQVINITDVGHLISDQDEGVDKIEKASQEQGKSAKEITEFYTNHFLEDLKELNINTEGTIFPRATKHIDEQIALIKKLEEKGFVYQISDGVYFDTSKVKGYEDLAKLHIEGLQEGARVAVNPEKKNPTDFALWKFSSAGEERQQEWESPWGVGFPGWHLECSAMSMKYLGETIDIHTGGIDHIPVHHTNEIAQSESATGKHFVRYWLHHEHVMVDKKKMSKSLGNVILLSDLRKKGFTPLAYRYWLLTAHYRTLVNFTWEALEGAETALLRLQGHYYELGDVENGDVDEVYKKEFMEHLHNDLNTPQAIAVLWKLAKDEEINKTTKKATMEEFFEVLGLDFSKIQKETPATVPQEVLDLVKKREEARRNKDWQKADELRDEITTLGFSVKDTDKGPEIIRK